MNKNIDTLVKVIPNEEKCTARISIYVKLWQKEQIRKNADICGMSLNEFITSRALGYEPMARLTEEEKEIGINLIYVRNDLRKFFSNFYNLPKDRRKYLLSNDRYIHDWFKILVDESNKMSELIEKIFERFRGDDYLEIDNINTDNYDSQGSNN